MVHILALLALGAAIELVASDSIQEASRIQLASELNVGFELVSKCTSYQYEAAELCGGRQPFKLYGDATSGCTRYFWCSPEHGACTFTCQRGFVFNQACNCCQPQTDAALYNISTCSSSSSSLAAQAPAIYAATPSVTTGFHRRMLQAADSQSISSIASSSSAFTAEDLMKTRARARARLAHRRRRREMAARAAAAASDDDDSITSNPSNMANHPLPDGPSTWNTYGKKYRGPWESRNVVKEPAFKVTQPQATAESSVAPQPSDVIAVPITGSGDHLPNRRSLLEQYTEAGSIATATAAAGVHTMADSLTDSPASAQRQVLSKRVKRLAAQAAAAAAASGDPADAAATADALERAANTGVHPHHMIRNRIRPMDKKPAAKAIDPEDEAEAPFAAAIAATEPVTTTDSRPLRVRARRAGQPAIAAPA